MSRRQAMTLFSILSAAAEIHSEISLLVCGITVSMIAPRTVWLFPSLDTPSPQYCCHVRRQQGHRPYAIALSDLPVADDLDCARAAGHRGVGGGRHGPAGELDPRSVGDDPRVYRDPRRDQPALRRQ